MKPEDHPFCQSCGLPLESDSVKGTNRDGSLSHDFCNVCYLEGSFTEPHISREEMAEKIASAMAEQRNMSKEAARAMVDSFIDHLERWSRRDSDEGAMAAGSANREA